MRKKKFFLLKKRIDYYPFGMPMPNRQIVGGEPYRYAYQGQEKDPETGKEAFQLRLWDGRIGRWLTTDPYRQFHSPYMGMGNNPINGVDSDGGCWADKGSTTGCTYTDGHATDFAGNSWSMVGGFENLDTAQGLAGFSITSGAFKHSNGGLRNYADINWQNTRAAIQMRNSVRNAGHDFLTNETTLAFAALVALPFAFEAAIAYAPYASQAFAVSTEGATAKFITSTTIESFNSISQTGGLGNVNVVNILGDTFLPNFGGQLLTSSFELSWNKGPSINSVDNIIINLGIGKVNDKIHNNIGKWSNQLGGKGGVKGLEYVLKGGSSVLTGMFSTELSK